MEFIYSWVAWFPPCRPSIDHRSSLEQFDQLRWHCQPTPIQSAFRQSLYDLLLQQLRHKLAAFPLGRPTCPANMSGQWRPIMQIIAYASHVLYLFVFWLCAQHNRSFVRWHRSMSVPIYHINQQASLPNAINPSIDTFLLLSAIFLPSSGFTPFSVSIQHMHMPKISTKIGHRCALDRSFCRSYRNPGVDCTEHLHCTLCTWLPSYRAKITHHWLISINALEIVTKGAHTLDFHPTTTKKWTIRRWTMNYGPKV